MADTQEQSFSTFTPISTDYIRGVDNPGGTPVSGNILVSAMQTYMQNNLLFFGAPNIVYTTSDFSKTSDITPADVPNLVHNVVAGNTYRFTCRLMITNNANGGSRLTWASSTCTVTSVILRTMFCGQAAIATLGSTALTEVDTELAKHLFILIEGFVVVSGSGTLQLQFAQNTSYATASTINAGSTFECLRVA